MTPSSTSTELYTLMQHPLWTQNARSIGQEASFFFFYGFSGDTFTPTSFPNGKDANTSFKLTARTMGRMLQLQNKTKVVQVIQAWKKDIIFDTLSNATEKIEQVNICVHGTSTRLSLTYHYDGGTLLGVTSSAVAAMVGTDDQKGLYALENDEALNAGYITRILTAAQKTKIKNNHASNASWQIWGCYAGYSASVFDTTDSYFSLLNFGASSIDGIAVEIAKNFGTRCTGAQGNGGLEFWHGEKGKSVVLNGTSTPAKIPFWLWLTTPATWHTFKATTGTEDTTQYVLGVSKAAADLTKPKPPKWFTDLYY